MANLITIRDTLEHEVFEMVIYSQIVSLKFKIKAWFISKFSQYAHVN